MSGEALASSDRGLWARRSPGACARRAGRSSCSRLATASGDARGPSICRTAPTSTAAALDRRRSRARPPVGRGDGHRHLPDLVCDGEHIVVKDGKPARYTGTIPRSVGPAPAASLGIAFARLNRWRGRCRPTRRGPQEASKWDNRTLRPLAQSATKPGIERRCCAPRLGDIFTSTCGGLAARRAAHAQLQPRPRAPRQHRGRSSGESRRGRTQASSTASRTSSAMLCGCRRRCARYRKARQHRQRRDRFKRRQRESTEAVVRCPCGCPSASGGIRRCRVIARSSSSGYRRARSGSFISSTPRPGGERRD